jgi:hypothetical protein
VTGRARTVALLAAGSVLAAGAVHTRLGFEAYGTADLVTVFFLNGAGSAVVAAWIAYDRRPFPLLAGLGVSLTSLLAFALSRVGDGVLGFRATGLDPAPEAAITLATEVLATGFLLAALAARRTELRALLGGLHSPLGRAHRRRP